MRKVYALLLGLLALLTQLPAAWAQGQTQNWYFGTQAGLQFVGGVPTALPNGALTSYEGCATLSTPAGQLLAYSNGEKVWDSQHQPMPNGNSGLGGYNSASQAALLLPLPGSTTQVYLFCVDAIDNNLVGGLRYSVLDFSLRGGLGDVAATKGVALPTPTVGGKVTEKLTAALHANGRDYWIIVHGWQNNAFYSFLLSPAGIAATPVISNSGSVHQGSSSFFNASNAVGCMRVSPDGQRLALAQRDNLTELFDFNNATGQVSGYVPLQARAYNYGVEFSPNSSRLYVSEAFGGVAQYNLLAGSPAAIANSGVQIGTAADRLGALQLGPDGRIYAAAFTSGGLDAIANPNALGTACLYQRNVVSLGGRISQNGLPNYPNAFAAPLPTLTATATTACAGAATTFTGTATPTPAGAVATWNFGDPASGSANTATGLTATHTYGQAGTYQATLTLTAPSLSVPASSTQAVTVLPLPAPRLPLDTVTCSSPVVLRPRGSWPAGSTFRWQDGSTGPTYLATTSGTYAVQVTSPAGCVAAASRRVLLNVVPLLRMPTDTAVCGSAVLLRARGVWPTGSTFRWQDGSTAPTFLATSSGSYSVQVTSPPGCVGQGQSTTRVVVSPVPVVRLPTDTLVCEGTSFVLRAGPQPAGTTYRWQDGSTAPTYAAAGPGTYSVEVRSAAGCRATATLVAAGQDCPRLLPNIITPNGDQLNEAFVLRGLKAADWSLTVFNRWGKPVYEQARYDNNWKAEGQAPGLYYYLLRHGATGQLLRGWVEVQRAD